MKSENGVVWLFASVGLAILAIAAWQTIQPGLCEGRIFLKAVEAGGATWCFEFWLNRYQTLIAAVLAFFAAVATGFFVYRQWAEARSAGAFNRRIVLIEAQDAAAAIRLTLPDVIWSARELKKGTIALLGSAAGVDQALLARTYNHIDGANERVAAFLTAASKPRTIISQDERANYNIAITALLEACGYPFRRSQMDFFIGKPDAQRQAAQEIEKRWAHFEIIHNDLMFRLMSNEQKISDQISDAEKEVAAR